MTGEEIQAFLAERGFILSVDEYMRILWSNPQICSISKTKDGLVELRTDEREYFRFKVDTDK